MIRNVVTGFEDSRQARLLIPERFGLLCPLFSIEALVRQCPAVSQGLRVFMLTNLIQFGRPVRAQSDFVPVQVSVPAASEIQSASASEPQPCSF